jgi:CubicO group peptidase (beta-lactamase class C family)
MGRLDVEAGDAALVVSEAALAVDLCPSGPDVCGSGETSSAMVFAGRPSLAMPAVAVAALSFEESLEERLCLPLQMPLIHGPPRLRRPRTSAPVTSLRRSGRIAAQSREADITKQAQRVLMNKLGLEAPSPNVASDTVRKYKAAFREPLSDYTHDALQFLLGGKFDPVAMELNMIGLDDEDN